MRITTLVAHVAQTFVFWGSRRANTHLWYTILLLLPYIGYAVIHYYEIIDYKASSAATFFKQARRVAIKRNPQNFDYK